MSGHVIVSPFESNCVILADRNYPLVEGIRGMLETVFENVVMVASVSSLTETTRRLQPRMVIVDLSLSGEVGLEWIARIREESPGVRMIAMSIHDEPSVRQRAMDTGCSGFVVKRDLASQLLDVVEQVLSLGAEPQS